MWSTDPIRIPGRSGKGPDHEIGSIGGLKGIIIIAEDLTPADTV